MTDLRTKHEIVRLLADATPPTVVASRVRVPEATVLEVGRAYGGPHLDLDRLGQHLALLERQLAQGPRVDAPPDPAETAAGQEDPAPTADDAPPPVPAQAPADARPEADATSPEWQARAADVAVALDDGQDEPPPDPNVPVPVPGTNVDADALPGLIARAVAHVDPAPREAAVEAMRAVEALARVLAEADARLASERAAAEQRARLIEEREALAAKLAEIDGDLAALGWTPAPEPPAVPLTEWSCRPCGREFVSERALQVHVRRKHAAALTSRRIA